ncbi:MAG: aldo/keto reductase [Bacillota bacterium]
MRYKKLDNTKNEISVLGFGCMRFPTIDGDNEKIHVSKSEKMLDYAYENGVNYFDTAWPYHGKKSEKFIGDYISKRDIRDEIYLATKLPSWLINSKEDMYKYFNKQLERLKTDYIDYYLIHSLNEKLWENLKDNGIFEFIDELKQKELIKHIGFSFHDEYEVFEKIIDDYDGWEFTQIQLNYLDENWQAGLKGLEYAKENDLDLIIMEPLKGGKIVGEIPRDIEKIFMDSKKKSKPVKWALDYLWNKPEVDILLSGMSNIDQVIENVEYADKSESNCFNKEDIKLIEKVKEEYKKRIAINCTQCKYCIPCPVEVNIPLAFKQYNNYKKFDNFEKFKNKYIDETKPKVRASKCIECGQCLDKCPQNIDIPKELKKVANDFE